VALRYISAVSVGLRLGPMTTQAVFQNIVLEDALSYAGMPSFKDALSVDDVKGIQAFIIADEISLRK
jgi:hypothetical protein